jgi:hypothetical protein
MDSQTSQARLIGPQDESNEQPNPRRLPRVRTPQDLEPKSEFEGKVAEVLQQEFGNLDAATRAAACFEHQIYEKMRADRLAEGYTQEDAGDLPAVFDNQWFAECSTNLAVVKATSRLVGLFGLAEQHDHIIRLLIESRFGAPPPSSQTREIFIGGSTHALTKELRDRRSGQR